MLSLTKRVKKFYETRTIRAKLAYQFTLIFAIILSLVFVAVYELTAISRKVAFRNQLKDRAVKAAEVFLASDNTTQARFAEIRREYLDKLPFEIIRAYDVNNKPVFIEDVPKYWNTGFVRQVRKNKELYFKIGNRECLGIDYHDNQGDYVVISSAIDTGSLQRLNSLKLVLVIVFGLSLAIVYFSGRWFARNALAPISGVIRQVQGISASNLHLRVDEGNKKDEISELAVTFNNLLGRLENSFEMQKSFVANASHELRTPITALIGEIEVTLNRERTPDDYRTSLGALLEQSEKLKAISDSMLDLAYAGTHFEDVEEIRVDELIWELKKHFDDKHKVPIVDVDMGELPEEPAGLVIRGNKNLLFIALSNILSNAIKFSNGNRITCILESRTSHLTIHVKDRGIGIEEAAIGRIFEPFFRAQNARTFGGQGIGLSLSEKIVQLHNGKITIVSELQKGTTFSVRF